MNVGHKEMNIGFLASHNGSNMQAIIDSCVSGALQAFPAVVISNNSASGALARAKEEGIPWYHFSDKTYPNPDDLDQAILDAMLEHAVNVVVLAGYMKKLGPRILSHFAGHILNIHPALLPKFGGKGMYGMHVHEAVIAAGETESGVSIHIVGGDTGDQMKLIASEAIDSAVMSLAGYQFTTQEFIPWFKQAHPEMYNQIVSQYGPGGKGSGKNYSANAHFGKLLSNHKGKESVPFLSWVKSPEGWGNSVIAFWEYNPQNVDTVRISNSIEDDISRILKDKDVPVTDKEAQILSRIGQGVFSKSLIAYWQQCPVTGCTDLNLLIASHIKPWSASSDQERLDRFNGLLLTPNLDRLLDKGLTTFSTAGRMKISSFLSSKTIGLMGISANSRIRIQDEHRKYLKYHSRNVFLG